MSGHVHISLFDIIEYIIMPLLQHNMATSVDKDAIKEAYNEVMADKNGVEW